MSSLAVSNASYTVLLERLNGIKEQVHGSIVKKTNGPLATDEYREAYICYLAGDPISNSLKIGTDGNGGFLVPETFEQMIISALEEENVFRKISTVCKTKHDVKIPRVFEKGQASWVDETGFIEDFDDTFNQIILRAYKMGTLMKVSNELLEDSVFDIAKYICDSFALRFGKTEEEAFLTGDGDKKPMGLLNDPSLIVAAESTVEVDIDDVIDLMTSVSARYRKKAVWLMNSNIHKVLYKIKSARGQNIWEPAIREPVPMKLLGYPVVICDSMPNATPGSKPILFGDFTCFLIGDRGNRSLKRLNELYATSNQVGFVATQRVDAKLILPDAIKCLQIKE